MIAIENPTLHTAYTQNDDFLAIFQVVPKLILFYCDTLNEKKKSIIVSRGMQNGAFCVFQDLFFQRPNTVQ